MRNVISWGLGTVLLPVLWLHQQPATAEEKPPVPFAYGTDQGPPLIHAYYVPSHHSDESFYRAILQGAKRHHWTFGDMEPVPSATMNDAVNNTKFVRWLQQYRKLY